MKKKYAIALHGGAGVIPKTIDEKTKNDHLEGLKAALQVGLEILQNNGTSLDAVEVTVKSLEDCIHFNAGRGAVFTNNEEHEMDASIMDGASLACGAVSSLALRKNPISLARLIMEKTNHVYLGGAGAETFADSLGIPKMPKSYFHSDYRYEQLQKAKLSGGIVLDHSIFDDEKEIKKKGTVGAVALDSFGNLAAATSTGGMTNKQFGRIGDSPVIGSGTYANNTSCAISCTGDGEEFLRHVVAYDIHSQMIYQNKSLKEATEKTVHQTLKVDDGGIIGIDFDGNIELCFNTAGMFRAAADSDGLNLVEIW